jgi:hypothetical protein
MKKVTKLALIEIGVVPNRENLLSLSGEQLVRFNEIMQRSRGVKVEDNFSINNTNDKDLLKFNTIKDWDYACWKNQQIINNTEYEYKDLFVNGVWIKAIEQTFSGDKELVYGSMSSVLSYVSTTVFENLEAMVDKKYPFIYIQKYGSTNLQDTEKRVCGKEKEREKAEKALEKMWPDIITMSKLKVMELSEYTFRKKIESGNDCFDLFLFGGIEAAAKSSFKTFFKDFSEKQQPFGVLDNIIEEITSKFVKKL